MATAHSKTIDSKERTKETVKMATVSFEKGELDEAAKLCSAVLSAAPRNAKAHYILGCVAQKSGRTKDAADHACAVARLRPDLSASQFTAGSCLLREKRVAEALTFFQAAVEIEPDNARCHLGVASCLRKLGRPGEATSALLRATAAEPRDARVNYKLGQHLRSTGDVGAAATAYTRALELDPGHALAAFWLPATRKLIAEACTKHGGGAADTDREGGQGVSRSHDDEDTGAAASPPTAPREYVLGLYNSYAETFDSHLQKSLSYRTPTIVVETLATLFPGRRWGRCLDLGCGTGLSGLAASSVCDRLAGVDLSPAMLGRARGKRVYDRLLVGDVTDTVRRLCREQRERSRSSWDVPRTQEERGGRGGHLEGGPNDRASFRESPVEHTAQEACAEPRSSGGDGEGPWGRTCAADLVLSCDVFVYIGDLRACFDAVHDLVGGPCGDQEGRAVFAFSVEATASHKPGVCGNDDGVVGTAPLVEDGAVRCSPGYELQGTGRYTHRKDYLERLCEETGFRVVATKDVVLRKNGGLPVRGFIFVAEAYATRPFASNQ